MAKALRKMAGSDGVRCTDDGADVDVAAPSGP